MRTPFDALRGSALDRLTGPTRARAEKSATIRSARARFIAGPRVEDAVEAAADLRRTDRLAILHPLLPPPQDASQVATLVAACRRARREMDAQGLAADHGSDLLVTPDHLGLPLGREVAQTSLLALTSVAEAWGGRITLGEGRLDQVQEVLDLADEVRPMYPQTGVTLVARRHRSDADAAALAEKGARVRLVRGGPNEPRTEAWSDRHEADLAWTRCLATLLAAPGETALVTHDPQLLEVADALIYHHGLGPEQVEQQMYYGVQPAQQMRLADAGHRVRVLIPYGPDWYDYLAQLAGRPSTPIGFWRVLSGRG